MKRIAFTLFVTTTLAVAQQPFRPVMDYYHNEKDFNGCVLVATNGQIDYLDAAGISNRQSNITINTKSKFKIASITKTFTAVLVMQLVEAGKIDLHATIGKYFPNYKGEAKDKVTIENLLTYSSGIPDVAEKLGMQSYQVPLLLSAYIDQYCSGNLIAVPGTVSTYSNNEYIILQQIVENVSQRPYAALLAEKILQPMGMENTQMLTSAAIVPGLVNSYTTDEKTGALGNDAPYLIENFFGAGALYSTVEDLLKFDNGLFSHKLLKPETVALMIAPHRALGNVGLGFWFADGYGVFSKKFVYRPGGILGATGNWIHTLEDNKSIIVFSNTDSTNLYEMSEQLYLVAQGKKATVATTSPVAAAKTTDLTKVKGTWTIDLRPGPNSEAYLKDFVIIPTSDNGFTGEFYGTAFDGGKFTSGWNYLYFAFTTHDRKFTYFHSGYIDGDKISGVSFSSGRNFISHWSGVKK